MCRMSNIASGKRIMGCIGSAVLFLVCIVLCILFCAILVQA